MMSQEEIRYHLTGPVTSVPTLFCQDGAIDFGGNGMGNFVVATGICQLSSSSSLQ